MYENEKKIWEIEKQYDSDEFNDDSSCLGYAINVYQETINKYFREYLVNFDYFKILMEDYGFVPLNEMELKQMKLKESIGSFQQLYTEMISEIENKNKNNYGDSNKMSENEKLISFLNNYFIFKKVRSVDARKVSLDFISNNSEIDIDETDEINSIINVKKKVLKKINKKIKL